MSENAKKTKVHALIIGINDYRENVLLAGNLIFPRLSGCINDANNILQYLESDPSLDLNVRKLYDKAATKPAIIDAFRTHLSKAGKDDVVFIYYSGHGAVEHADEKIWMDPRLECLVCHYEKPHSPDFLLADKELRILLKELYDKTKAHIVTIFDCCHSGDNTREIAAATEGIVAVKRQIDHQFPQRKWEEFVFAGQFKPEQFAGKSMNLVIDQAPHIQIAAAEKDEAALEVNGSGVLTSYLLNSLRACGGNLTYRDLHSRIRNQLKYRFVQKPKVYAPDTSLDLLEKGFFKKDVDTAANTANMVYNKSKGWRIDRGTLHGVAAGVTNVVVTADGETNTFAVGETDLDAAQVKDVFGLDKNKAYLVKLSGLATQTIRVELVNKDFFMDEFMQVVEAITKPENAAYVALEDDPKKADYSLLLWRDMLYLTKPGDHFRPLFRPIHFTKTDDDGNEEPNPKALPTLMKALRHISEWTLLQRMENNSGEVLDAGALSVKCFRTHADGSEKPLDFDKNKKAKVEYEAIVGGSKKWGGKVRIEMKNTTQNTKLYVAALYLQADFGATPRLMEPLVAEIEPGQTKTLQDHKSGYLRMSLDDRLYWYNVPNSTDTLKFIVSTEPFEVTGLEKNSLPEPWNPDLLERTRSLEGQAKGFAVDEEDETPQLSGWNALTYHFDFQNPAFNAVKKKDVVAMLKENDELAHFATGLYFKHGKKGGLDAGLSTIELAEDVAEKGFAWDATLSIANGIAGTWRRRRYKKMARRNPDLPRFVSEGDSWFQHPMLKDIIDYVGEKFPVYCMAEAGDTIENYLKEGEMFKAIEEVKPKGFLLSGGGNDILGESMVNFLQKQFDDAPEGEMPDRFFNQDFENALGSVINNYRSIFNYLKKNYPEMKVFTHGYDYPRPLAPGTKKGWIGKYFDQFGILRSGDRSHAVHFMMDEFNKRLEALTAEYPGQVEYINLRQRVRDDQWDDEIHPTDEGYGEVGLKFIERIVGAVDGLKA
jgi:hypothetical protein